MDLADYEDAKQEQINEEFLKELNVVKYEELSDKTIESLKEDKPDVYTGVLLRMFSEAGYSD